MKIEVVATLDRIPECTEPPEMVGIPEDTQAVMFHILHPTVNKPQFGVTSEKTVWFQCPSPIVYKANDRGFLSGCLFINKEVMGGGDELPESDLTLEIAVVRKESNMRIV